MAKVIGIHRLELKPGVTEEQVQALATQITREMQIPGGTVTLGQGDRGERAGQYVMIIEIDSVETRDRYFPRSIRRAFRRVEATRSRLRANLRAI